jgi:hypothetical protein
MGSSDPGFRVACAPGSMGSSDLGFRVACAPGSMGPSAGGSDANGDHGRPLRHDDLAHPRASSRAVYVAPAIAASGRAPPGRREQRGAGRSRRRPSCAPGRRRGARRRRRRSRWRWRPSCAPGRRRAARRPASTRSARTSSSPIAVAPPARGRAPDAGPRRARRRPPGPAAELADVHQVGALSHPVAACDREGARCTIPYQ